MSIFEHLSTKYYRKALNCPQGSTQIPQFSSRNKRKGFEIFFSGKSSFKSKKHFEQDHARFKPVLSKSMERENDSRIGRRRFQAAATW